MKLFCILQDTLGACTAYFASTYWVDQWATQLQKSLGTCQKGAIQQRHVSDERCVGLEKDVIHSTMVERFLDSKRSVHSSNSNHK